MLLKIAPYFEYMPCWYYDRDARYKEKWRRRLWRWGSQMTAIPVHDGVPPQPPAPPPDAEPPENTEHTEGVIR